MTQIFLSSLFGCISLYGLYFDYCNRKYFKNNFYPDCEIDGKKIFEGLVITGRIFQTKTYPFIIFQNHPFYCVDTYKKHFYTEQIKNKNFFHLSKIHIADYYWDVRNIYNYISPNIKFNDIDMYIDKNSLIHYTRNKIYCINDNKKIMVNYIPNNSIITIFAVLEENKIAGKIHQKYRVEFIGPKDKIIEDIAYKYYGISDNLTFLLGSIFIASAFLFAISIKY